MAFIFFLFRMSPTILLFCYDEKYFLLLRSYLCPTGKYPAWSFWVGLGLAQENETHWDILEGWVLGLSPILVEIALAFLLLPASYLSLRPRNLLACLLEAALSLLASWRRFFFPLLREKLWQHWERWYSPSPLCWHWEEGLLLLVGFVLFFPWMARSAL